MMRSEKLNTKNLMKGKNVSVILKEISKVPEKIVFTMAHEQVPIF